MSNDIKYSHNAGPRPASPARQAPRPARNFSLSLEEESPRGGMAPRNPDPYNSSGSFDRTKNWARVGKR